MSDGALWVVDYSENGAREGDPQQVPEATLFVDRTYSQPVGQTTTFESPAHLHPPRARGVLERDFGAREAVATNL